MNTSQITISESFKKKTAQAILSIFLFITGFVLILVAGVCLAALSIYGGVMLIILLTNYLGLLGGAGIIGIGVFLLVFLFKFLFSSNKNEAPDHIRIYRENEPEIFAVIDEIAEQTGTQFPKKVLISPEINASVFYDSAWLSIFFPARKNLVIGIGLVNSVTTEELKAILAHEFGHFSQNTMKIGSVIYQFNKVTYDLLFDNDSFSRWIDKWANTSTVIAFFTSLCIQIIKGIQWLLKQLYDIVNKSYMSLSKEMEYHADEVAVRTIGVRPMKAALMRLDFAQFALEQSLSFYGEHPQSQAISANIYHEHKFLMSFYASENNISTVQGFPVIEMKDLKRFNYSKLNYEDQWASHPTMDERIAKMQSYGIGEKEYPLIPANTLFRNIEDYQLQFTQLYFRNKPHTEPLQQMKLDEFRHAFEKRHTENQFPTIFNGYYSRHFPGRFNPDSLPKSEKQRSLQELFSDEIVSLIYETQYTEQDAIVLKQIYMNEIPVKTFEYDGVRYEQDDSIQIQTGLVKKVESYRKSILDNDIQIYQYFEALELPSGVFRLRDLYFKVFDHQDWIEQQTELFERISESLQFLYMNITVNEAIENFMHVRTLENELKSSISKMTNDPAAKDIIHRDVMQIFGEYLSQEWRYIENEELQQDRLNLFFSATGHFQDLLYESMFHKKKILLKYQEQLEQSINASSL